MVTTWSRKSSATSNFLPSIAVFDQPIIRSMEALPERLHSSEIRAAIRSAAFSLRSRLRSENSLWRRVSAFGSAGFSMAAVVAGSVAMAGERAPAVRATAQRAERIRIGGNLFPPMETSN
jgi:hypothetical protein